MTLGALTETSHRDRTLADYLGDFTWRPRTSRRERLPHGAATVLPMGIPSLVYVLIGGVRPARPRSLAPVAVDPCDGPLRGGDFLFSTGRLNLALQASEDAEFVVVELDLMADRAQLEALPDALTVRDFVETNSAVARLAADMGCPQRAESAEGQGLEDVICSHIATTVMSVAIRTWVERGCAPQDWLMRAHDPLLAKALDVMHRDPGRAWSVRELAQVATMSRSVFALRFREVLRTSPAQYLTELRVTHAKRHLAQEGRTVAETSRLLGYASEDGFSRAFRRHTGVSPSRWRADVQEPTALPLVVPAVR